MNHHLSEALVDYSGIAKTVNDLLGRFTILQFLDFCSLIEGIVLYDRLIMVGGINSKVGGPEDNVESRWNEGLKLLLDEAIIVREKERSRPVNIGEPPDRRSIDRDSGYDLGYTIVDAWYDTGRLLGAEQLYKKPSLPLLRQKPFYEKSAHVLEEHSVCDLFGRYKDLDAVLSRIRKTSILPTVDYVSVPIPSLPLLVLQRSASTRDLLRVALEVRDEYHQLRASLSSLRQTLADLSIAPNEKMKAIASWVKAWNTLSKYEEQASFFQVATATNSMVDAAKSMDGIGLDSLKWSKLIEAMIGRFEKSFYEWKVRQLHKSAKYYLSIPESEFSREILRLFGHQIAQRDIEILRRAGIELTRQ